LVAYHVKAMDPESVKLMQLKSIKVCFHDLIMHSFDGLLLGKYRNLLIIVANLI